MIDIPIVDVTHKGTEYGYQYLVPRYKTSGEPNKKAQNYRPYLPKQPPYFEIDLSTPGSRTYTESKYRLEHIVRLMLTYGDIGFVMKKWDSPIIDVDTYLQTER